MTFATGLGSSGGTLTKAGLGALTLTGASTYSGTTTVSGGKLLFQGSKSGSGNITVADGATLGVTEGGTQVTPGTLTLGTSAGANWGNDLAVDGSITVIPPPTLNFTKIGNSLQFSWTGSFKLQAQTNSLNVGLSTNLGGLSRRRHQRGNSADCCDEQDGLLQTRSQALVCSAIRRTLERVVQLEWSAGLRLASGVSKFCGSFHNSTCCDSQNRAPIALG